MQRVIVESPFASPDPAVADMYLRYARAALHDCFERDEIPFASHLLYTQRGILDDTIPEERTKGIEGGYAWWAIADAVVFYADFGFSKGMLAARKRAEQWQRVSLGYTTVATGNEDDLEWALRWERQPLSRRVEIRSLPLWQTFGQQYSAEPSNVLASPTNP